MIRCPTSYPRESKRQRLQKELDIIPRQFWDHPYFINFTRQFVIPPLPSSPLADMLDEYQRLIVDTVCMPRRVLFGVKREPFNYTLRELKYEKRRNMCRQ